MWEVKRPKLCALPKYPSDGGSKHGEKDWYIEKLTNAMKPEGLTEGTPNIDKNTELVMELAEDLKGMRESDIEELYNNVSNALVDRNGYVVDYNMILSSVMECNTNSMFLLGQGNRARGRYSTSAPIYARIWLKSSILSIYCLRHRSMLESIQVLQMTQAVRNDLCSM